ncbi:hypothetical protein FGG08_006366 [Glutinoglossum americanum]|uniref:Uncharacterized protein n=1 Tax=Glutinoglossum americanum TaxID=1670608 RepID=A0A9P8HW81_9PEZI|nr:hypothetical protein FGG08_006366 [Glutinoglossum americanum]
MQSPALTCNTQLPPSADSSSSQLLGTVTGAATSTATSTATNTATSTATSAATGTAALSSSLCSAPATCPPSYTTAISASLGTALALAVLIILGLIPILRKQMSMNRKYREMENSAAPMSSPVMLSSETPPVMLYAGSQPHTRPWEAPG